MAKNRIYTRKELESLRRADLQNLYKIHGLKGANQKSDALIDSLLSHFTSATFSTRPASPGGRRLRPLEVVGRDTKRRIAAGGGAKEVVEVDIPIEDVIFRSAEVQRIGTVEIQPEAGPSRVTSPNTIPLHTDDWASQISALTSRIAALETRPTSSTNPIPAELVELQSQLATLRAVPRGITSAELVVILEERDRIWEERLRKVEESWEERFTALQQTFNSSSLPRPGMTRGNTFGLFGMEPVPEVIRTSTTPSPRKRPNPPSPFIPRTPGAGPPSPKKARLQPPTPSSETSDELLHEGSTREEPEDDDEPPLTPAPPRTPSPGHQGLRPDNSKSPVIGGESTYFSQPPNYATLAPMYATTPRPSSAPLISPTVDAPPSASRARLAGTGPPPTQLLTTPTRVRAERIMPVSTTRAVSDAHHGLSSITDDEGPSSGMGMGLGLGMGFGSREREIVRRRVASADPHLEAGIIIRDGSLTPSRLSPSPSIPDSVFKKPKHLPSRFGRAAGASSREYMEVVAHGQEPKTPSGVDGVGMEGGGVLGEGVLGEGMETPGSGGLGERGGRTLLGTERWRDTRFGDVPVVQWSTPRVDLGPGTPGWGSG